MSFVSNLLTNSYQRLIFAFFSGLILIITAPYIGFGIYTWIGLVPLFLLVRSSSSYKTASLEALVFLLAYNLSFFIWIFGVHPLTWLHIGNTESLVVTFAIWFFTASFHSIVLIPVILVSKFIFQRNKKEELPIIYILLIAFSWVLITHTLILNLEPNLASIAIPLNQIVYSQYQYKELIQCCNIIGAIGLEFFIISVNLLLLNVLDTNLKIKEEKSNKYFAIITVLFVAMFLYGKLEVSNTNLARMANKDKFKSFAIVQANYPLASKEIQTALPMDSIELQYQLSNTINSKVDFLFWAEGSVRMLNKSQIQATLFRDLANKANVFVYSAPLLILDKAYNVIDFMEYTSAGIPITNITQTATGFNLKHYYKSRLMPFGEYTPFYNFLPSSLKEISDNTIGQNYIPSSANKSILINNVQIANSLCSELLFPQILRNQVREGAELMLNLNDLSWFKSPLNITQTTMQISKDQLGEDMVKKLFFAVAIFRAIENKRDLILASNTGYSGLINPAGQIIILSETNQTAVLQNSFLPSRDKSIYTRLIM